MSAAVKNIILRDGDIPLKEVCRYMGLCEEAANALQRETIHGLMFRFLKDIRARACYLEVPVSVTDDMVDLELLRIKSEHLAKNLHGCERAILFAATLGTEADRIYRSSAVTSSVSALTADAIGTAAIEAVCDKLCCEIAEQYSQYKLRPRFSPGYGDLSLYIQRDIVRILDTYRKIGLTLSDSLLMIPQKSVTAIVGLESKS